MHLVINCLALTNGSGFPTYKLRSINTKFIASVLDYDNKSIRLNLVDQTAFAITLEDWESRTIVPDFLDAIKLIKESYLS